MAFVLIAVALIAIVVAMWPFVGPTRADLDTLRPWPVGVEEVATTTIGCNFAGPEPGYLIEFLAIRSSAPLSDLRRHLLSAGYDMTGVDAEYAPPAWAELGAHRHDAVVWVGSAAAFLAAANEPGLSYEGVALAELEHALQSDANVVVQVEPVASCL